MSKFSGGACPKNSQETFPFNTQIGVSHLLHETSSLLPKLNENPVYLNNYLLNNSYQPPVLYLAQISQCP